MSDFADTARSLLSLEINTVLKAGMSARKMPAVAAEALVELGQAYHIYLCRLARDFGPTGKVLNDAVRALSILFEWGLEPFPQPPGPPREIRVKAEGAVPAEESDGTPGFVARSGIGVSFEPVYLDTDTQLVDIRFDYLHGIAAWLRAMRERAAGFAADPARAADTFGEAAVPTLAALAAKFDEEDNAVLLRIQRTCDRLRALSPDDRQVIRRGMNIKLAENDLVVLRKAWDVGTEIVVMQTVVQIDGDVITRIVPSRASALHAPLHALHRSAVDVSFQHWRTLVTTVARMAGDAFKALIGQ